MHSRFNWRSENVDVMRAGAAAGKTAAEVCVDLGIDPEREYVVRKKAARLRIRFRSFGRVRKSQAWKLTVLIGDRDRPLCERASRRRAIKPGVLAENILRAVFDQGPTYLDNLLDDGVRT